MRVYPPDAKWHEMADGGVIPQAGNAEEYDVSGWRSAHPVRDDECCIQCLFCWIYCPDNSVLVKDQKVVALDPKHCKGCGICAQVCPKDCITMQPGGDMPEEEDK